MYNLTEEQLDKVIELVAKLSVSLFSVPECKEAVKEFLETHRATYTCNEGNNHPSEYQCNCQPE